MDLKWKEPYVHVEAREISATQRIISLQRKYHPGQGDLVIYYNGSYAVNGKDYTEVSPYTVEFLFDLEPGDTVVFHHQKLW